MAEELEDERFEGRDVSAEMAVADEFDGGCRLVNRRVIFRSSETFMV